MAIFLALVAGACASGAGERAFREGRFGEAAEAFEGELKHDRRNAALQRRLEEARIRSIGADLDRARELRAGGQAQAALVLFARTQLHVDAWRVPLASETARQLAEEVTFADTFLRRQINDRLADKSPLAARAILERYRPILASPAFRPTVASLDRALSDGGRARCAELLGEQPEAEAPYWRWVLGRYCAAFGVPRPKQAQPGLFKGLRVAISMKTGGEPERRILEDWLAKWFKRTVWYAAEATELAAARVESDFDASLEKRPATLHVPYHRRRTNTVTDESVPFSRPHEVVVDSEEDFVYQATLYLATYHIDATISLDLGSGIEPFLAHVKRDESKRGYDHDVTFRPADIYPQRPNVPSAAGWLSQYLGQQVKPLSMRLDQRWTRAYCGVTARTLEGASRCLFAGQPSADAAAIISKKLGRDGGPALDLFHGLSEPDEEGGAADEEEKPAPTIETTAPAKPSSI